MVFNAGLLDFETLLNIMSLTWYSPYVIHQNFWKHFCLCRKTLYAKNNTKRMWATQLSWIDHFCSHSGYWIPDKKKFKKNQTNNFAKTGSNTSTKSKAYFFSLTIWQQWDWQLFDNCLLLISNLFLCILRNGVCCYQWPQFTLVKLPSAICLWFLLRTIDTL